MTENLSHLKQAASRLVVPHRELCPVEHQVLVNGHARTDARTNRIALPELRPALLGRN